MKLFPRMLSQRWNSFRVCSASDEICSAYSILNVDFEMGLDFHLCSACAKIGYLLAEQARKLVIRWLSMHENWLLVGWVCTKIDYSWAEHARNLVLRPLSRSHGSAPCLPSSPRPCPHSSPTCPLSSIPCFFVPFLWLYSTVRVLSSSVSRPLFLHLLSSVLCLLYLRECEIFLKLYLFRRNYS